MVFELAFIIPQQELTASTAAVLYSMVTVSRHYGN